MTLLGRWSIVEMPDDDYRDTMEPAYILFGENGSGEFAFGCVTGQIFGGGDTDTVEFSWTGNDQMDEAQGDGWAELQPNGTLKGQICFDGGDDANFAARRETSSTAC
ncbi:MAG: hypothetical protein JWP49_354 [Phenylobacterium sp.]|nr:hypothetical protein [Phenylobacterium sp.]